jgi:hypothetical protein
MDNTPFIWDGASITSITHKIKPKIHITTPPKIFSPLDKTSNSNIINKFLTVNDESKIRDKFEISKLTPNFFYI